MIINVSLQSLAEWNINAQIATKKKKKTPIETAMRIDGGCLCT